MLLNDVGVTAFTTVSVSKKDSTMNVLLSYTYKLIFEGPSICTFKLPHNTCLILFNASAGKLYKSEKLSGIVNRYK